MKAVSCLLPKRYLNLTSTYCDKPHSYVRFYPEAVGLQISLQINMLARDLDHLKRPQQLRNNEPRLDPCQCLPSASTWSKTEWRQAIAGIVGKLGVVELVIGGQETLRAEPVPFVEVARCPSSTEGRGLGVDLWEHRNTVSLVGFHREVQAGRKLENDNGTENFRRTPLGTYVPSTKAPGLIRGRPLLFQGTGEALPLDKRSGMVAMRVRQV